MIERASSCASSTENVLETMLHYCVTLVNVLFLCKPPHLGRLNPGCVWKGEGGGDDVSNMAE